MSVSRKHAGFTLIELMIVVAIIAILAAIALPSYHDYTVRAQVSECGVVGAGAKVAVSESLSNRGVLPADNDAAGLAAAADITGKYVSSVTVTNGEIACLYSNVAPFRANSGITGQRLLLTPNYVSSDGSVTWTCSSPTILQKFLSAACRTNLN